MQAGGMFKFDVFGTEEVRRQFARLNEISKGDALKVTAQRTYEFAQESADKHTKTGELARSVNMRRDGEGWFIGHDPGPVYALFVHWGSKPHAIAPKNKRALRWASGGKFRFAKRVNHPGYRGDPYFVRAAARIPQLFAAEVEKRLNQ